MLACEGYCLCGADVAAPHQLRYGTKPLLQTLDLMRPQLVDSEVGLNVSKEQQCSISFWSRSLLLGAAVGASLSLLAVALCRLLQPVKFVLPSCARRGEGG